MLWNFSQTDNGKLPSTASRNPSNLQKPHFQKPMNINIAFNTDGTAQCLWTEALPLHEIGRLEVTRASNLEFNNSTQHWEVKDRRGRIRFIAKSRSACLEWEEMNLQPG
jgi:hypothetical protein